MSMLTLIYLTNIPYIPHKPLKKTSASVRLTTHFMYGMMYDLTICKHRKEYDYSWHQISSLRPGVINQLKTQTPFVRFHCTHSQVPCVRFYCAHTSVYIRISNVHWIYKAAPGHFLTLYKIYSEILGPTSTLSICLYIYCLDFFFMKTL